MRNDGLTWVFAALFCLISAGAGWAQQAPPTIPGLPLDLEAQLKAGQEADDGEEAEGSEDQAAEFGEPQARPKTYEEIVELWMTPVKIHKQKIVPIDARYAYPHAAVPFKMEIVGEEGDFVWLKGIPPEDPESAMHKMWLQRQATEAQHLVKREYDEKLGVGSFLDFARPIVPPATIDAVDFVPAGQGLPTGGKWQMGLDLADMNGDGLDDLVLPPPRLGKTPHPTVYLANGDGTFTYWKAAKWNPEVAFDYGDVEVGDFDQDGNLDLVIAIHFGAQYVLYGSENHEFRRFVKLPSPDPRVTSRATTVGDFDLDGRLDVAFLAELDLDLGQNKRVKGTPTLWIVTNTANGWRLDPDYPTQFVIGDVLRSADMDGDGREDLILASNTSAWRAIVFFNREDGRWETLDERNMLGNSFHFGIAPVAPDGSNDGVLFSAFEQFMRHRGEQSARTGIVRYDPITEDWSEISYTTLFYDDDRFNPYFRVASGDFNNDGVIDVAVSRKKGGLEVWIGTEGGRYYRNPNEGFVEGMGRVYDLWIDDVNGDGRDDLIAATAQLDADRSGGIKVWLSQVPS